MTHKVYVLGYRTVDDDKIPPKRPFEGAQNIGVNYSAEPDWLLPDRSTAEIECASLRGMDVHVGSHYCNFAVETVDDGQFAIACLSHPKDLRLAQSLNGATQTTSEA